MALLDIELALTRLWSPVLPSHPQTCFKKSVTFVTFHDFYKGNLSNKLHSTVSSSAVPYLSCFTARGWMPSGLGDRLLFILLYFFFFINPLLLALESETISHTCLLQRERGAEPYWAPPQRALMQRFYLTSLIFLKCFIFILLISWPSGCFGRFPSCDRFRMI